MIKNKIKLSALILIVTTTLVNCSDLNYNKFVNKIKKPTNSSETNNNYKARWMAGSWGVTHRVNGGYKLDKSASKSNWQAGAKQIVKNIPAAKYVITSFTHPAHAYLFTLRTNENVDVASIHPDMVPSLKNEQIILDVIDIYRKAGKKIILYLNAAGPSMAKSRRDPDIQKAWEKYYKTKWNGDEAAAWRNLVLGYAKRFNGLIDGYWLDNARNLPGELSDFTAMLRSVDPSIVIGVNKGQEYFKDKNNKFILVDSDGLNDKDKRDYKIVKHEINNQYTDFTSGHITPMRRGAPPSSWGYEEYTLRDMVKKPWGTYNGKKYGLKHGWFPIRDKWSGSTANLMFDLEKAYRFTRTITDGGAAITWSTTQNKGYMTKDEMQIMTKISDKMMQNPKAKYKPYKRPKGAYLVGEKK